MIDKFVLVVHNAEQLKVLGHSSYCPFYLLFSVSFAEFDLSGPLMNCIQILDIFLFLVLYVTNVFVFLVGPGDNRRPT